ncbi:unnamed protein product [Heterobilharzia americana]|nr:unnamed protein product [Heterobilharzia americana]CAH8666036.1 unnamed protein product [Heterobilharzia americana]
MVDTVNKDITSEHINIKVQGQEGSIIHFKIKKNTPLRKLMMAYCERLGLKQPSVRFIFDGNNVHDTDTPASLEMEENDTIEVFQTQTGGS